MAGQGKKIPPISLSKGEQLLSGMRSSVMDYFSITSLHFIHLEEEGLLHFVLLLNSTINHINCASMAELNTIWAITLHKGHNKDPEIDRSWRTISCCPIIAKALDIYMVHLYDKEWTAVQAPTQFQGINSSHDLASLSITESVIQGLYTTNKPVFMLRVPLTG